MPRPGPRHKPPPSLPPPPPPDPHHQPPPPDPHHQPPPPTTRLLRCFRVFRSVFRLFPMASPVTIPLIPAGRLLDGHGHGHGHGNGHGHGHGHGNANYVTGTLYGHRSGCVTLSIQENPKTRPMVILELELETDILQMEMSLGTVRIVLECEKEPERLKLKLLEEPLWTMFFNGKKGGRGVKRDATEFDSHVIELLRKVSMGAGALTAKSGTGGPDGEISYMRAHFDREVGSKDSETLYMMSQDGNIGSELSIFFARI